MPTYAVKIGTIVLKASRPVTDEDRKRVAAQLRKRGTAAFLTVDDMEIEIVVTEQ